jgi:DNA-binding NarL/FixJ family response regulator
MTQLVRVFLIDDHQLVTEALTAFLAAQQELAVSGSTASLDEAIEKVRSLPIAVVLINADMDGALEVIRDLKEELPSRKVIVFGLNHRTDDVLEFIEAGASGYLWKEASGDELVHTIEAVYQGQSPCSPQVAASVFARITELSRERSQRTMLQQVKLTPREKEVLQLIAAGLSNKEIAHQLHITLYTAKNHVHNILEKLRVNYRQEAIRCAYDNGMLKGPWPFRLPLGPD